MISIDFLPFDKLYNNEYFDIYKNLIKKMMAFKHLLEGCLW